ncbi:hypothetical protein [uncultured Shewanella sp.]|uniref:hypothetical protein n=1 Tax=uncultured Shewanella sp. TaxID=173975 RepID=UPI002626CB17|nr:hypothetical protein [uncultured Shewanella sp.]
MPTRIQAGFKAIRSEQMFNEHNKLKDIEKYDKINLGSYQKHALDYVVQESNTDINNVVQESNTKGVLDTLYDAILQIKEWLSDLIFGDTTKKLDTLLMELFDPSADTNSIMKKMNNMSGIFASENIFDRTAVIFGHGYLPSSEDKLMYEAHIYNRDNNLSYIWVRECSEDSKEGSVITFKKIRGQVTDMKTYNNLPTIMEYSTTIPVHTDLNETAETRAHAHNHVSEYLNKIATLYDNSNAPKIEITAAKKLISMLLRYVREPQRQIENIRQDWSNYQKLYEKCTSTQESTFLPKISINTKQNEIKISISKVYDKENNKVLDDFSITRYQERGYNAHETGLPIYNLDSKPTQLIN